MAVLVAITWRRGVLLLMAEMVWVLSATPASAQTARAPEYSLKAAYLFNFTQFIEWPSNCFVSAEAPIIIGVLGEDPFGGALDQAIRDKTLRGRPFEIRRSRRLGDLGGCHMVFVCASEAKRVPEILAANNKKSVVTISDLDRFGEQGGIIGFYTENNRLRFQINVGAAERAGIKISSQLLRLGTIIREKGDAEK